MKDVTEIAGECVNCTDGFMGRYCNEICPINCEDGCDRESGVCNNCTSGYTGKYCNETCSSYCHGGCHRGECNSCTSARKGEKCPYCPAGRYGNYCNETFPPNCRSCFKNTAAGPSIEIQLTVIVTTVAVGITLFFIIQIRRRRRKRWKISENSFKNSQISDNPVLTECTCDNTPTTECLKVINPTYILQADDGDKQHVAVCEELTGERSIDHIMEEFQKLPRPDIRDSKCGSLEENFEKNRYTDVKPFDETRVSLEVKDDEENDYINASYIKGYTDEIQYVAAQGPNCETVNDFWKMIWQLNTAKIVMLTNLVEAGKVKCEMYWPFCNSEYQSYGKVCVQCVEEKVYQYYTLRTLTVWKDTFEKRTVHQFHFTAWPDHGVPEDTKSTINFHRVVKDTGPNHQGLMVIHCSAGVGRSGTFLAFDYLLDQTEQEGRVCVFKCVQDLRLQRMKMVQTKVQYKFLYDMVTDALQHRSSSPVYVQCKECWYAVKKTDRESAGSDTDYHVLWECGIQERDSSNSESDVLLMVDDENRHQSNTLIKMESEEDVKISIDTKVENKSHIWIKNDADGNLFSIH